MAGNTVSHSNRKAPRSWNANVHKVKYKADNGEIVSGYVCTKCLRSGKVEKISSKPE